MNDEYSNILHPELMSDQQMRDILTMRCIKIDNMNSLQRSQLLDIYVRVVLPLQQRESRNEKNRNIAIEKDILKRKCEDMTIDQNKRSDNLNSSFRKIQIRSTLCGNDIDNQSLRTLGSKRTLHPENKEAPPLKKQKKPITWP